MVIDREPGKPNVKLVEPTVKVSVGPAPAVSLRVMTSPAFKVTLKGPKLNVVSATRGADALIVRQPLAAFADVAKRPAEHRAPARTQAFAHRLILIVLFPPKVPHCTRVESYTN